jgi:potassium uptake TrkH family protein
VKRLFLLFDQLILALGFLVTGILVIYFGFPSLRNHEDVLMTTLLSISTSFVSVEIMRLILSTPKIDYFKSRLLDFVLILFLFVSFYFRDEASSWISDEVTQLSQTGFVILAHGACLLTVFYSTATERFQQRLQNLQISLRPPQIFLLGFLIPIGIGTLLLMMPASSQNGLSLVDAFFTAVSAMSVTGLATINVGTELTAMGQFFLLALIQIGGLGIMTLTITFASVFVGGLGVRERLLMAELLSADRFGQIKSLLLKICVFTFTIEFTGALLLYYAQFQGFDQFQIRAFLVHLFHAVSAFCNAGFSIYPEGLMQERIQQNTAYLGTLMSLIVLGGLGFPVLVNLYEMIKNQFRRQRMFKVLSVTSKLVLTSTLLLLVGGMLLFGLIESRESMKDLPLGRQIFESLFFSVTTRTAGFNIFPLETISGLGLLVLMSLMWIGGAPMSTAGGIKVTTLAVAILNVRAQILGKSRIEVFGRQISQQSLNRAFAAMGISLALISLGSLVLLLLEPKIKSVDLIFESLSAFTTVGLSRGITDDLSSPSKLILCLLMLIGRIGAITFLASFFAPKPFEDYKLLEEQVLVN